MVKEAGKKMRRKMEQGVRERDEEEEEEVRGSEEKERERDEEKRRDEVDCEKYTMRETKLCGEERGKRRGERREWRRAKYVEQEERRETRGWGIEGRGEEEVEEGRGRREEGTKKVITGKRLEAVAES